MPIDKTKKYTFEEWMKIIQEEVNKPYQVKVEAKIEKKDKVKK